MKNTALLGILAVLAMEAGCMMGPKYKRPSVDVSQEYRAPAPQQAAQASSLGNEQWWQVYQDPVLTQLIHTAIAQNYDVRIAAARVLEAQAQVGITRSNQLPSASVGEDVFSQQNPKVSKLLPANEVNGGELNLSVIWNLDFWGKYRRQTEAARAQLLATEWGQRAVISSLVANVATAYFQLRALDSELEISQRTLASRRESLKLTQFLESHGSNSALDVSQSEQLVYTASETIPDLERQIQQQENVLSVLLGENPNPSPADARLPNSPSPRTFRPAFLRNYSSAGRTSAKPKKSWLQPTPRSAWPKPHSFQTCRSPDWEGWRATPCTTSSQRLRRLGTRPSM
jgi:multidrug efflux system outer membrane protein